jgi:hypothetical protein
MLYTPAARSPLVWLLASQEIPMKSFRSLFASLAIASTSAAAQLMHPEGAPAPRVDIVALLSLDAARAQQVHAILQTTHERIAAARAQIGRPTDDTTRAVMHAAMQAIREDTDRQLASVLTPDELVKLHAAMPRPFSPAGMNPAGASNGGA